MDSMIVELSSSRCFDGYQKVISHESRANSCRMKFGIYLPPQATNDKRLPLIYCLAGLTSTEQNFIQKSGYQKYAAKYGFIVVCPDTSPRGEDIPDEARWNVGVGAGHYVDATCEPWCKNYNMYSYFTEELPALLQKHFHIDFENVGIVGHSMGGSGALISKFRNPEKYKSISLFAPVCDAARTPPMVEAYSLYFGSKPSDGAWDIWSGTRLAKSYKGPSFDILLDQGADDQFLSHLYPEDFVKAATDSGIRVTFNMREGYDHGYFFISTFIKTHFEYHAKYLCSKS